MHFRRKPSAPEPEINLIPFIDVLLVIMIFLVLSTSWTRLTEINMNLAVAEASQRQEKSGQVVLSVTADGHYNIDRIPVPVQTAQALAAALGAVATRETRLIISADAAATHQAVVHAMEAARLAGLSQITFATQAKP